MLWKKHYIIKFNTKLEASGIEHSRSIDKQNKNSISGPGYMLNCKRVYSKNKSLGPKP